MNYWSRGEFGKLSEEAERYSSRLASVAEAGIDGYLKSETNRWTLPELVEDIRRVGEMHAAMPRIRAMCRERFESSCERWEWAEALIEFFTREINFVLIEDETGYKLVSEEAAASSCFAEYTARICGGETCADTREWFEIAFRNMEETKIFIYIVPHEDTQNLTVRNAVLLHIDYTGAADERFNREVMDNAAELLRAKDADVEIAVPQDLAAISLDSENVFFEVGKKLQARASGIKS